MEDEIKPNDILKELTIDEKSLIRNEMNSILQPLKDDLQYAINKFNLASENILLNLEKTAQDIFENAKFISKFKKSIHRFIEQEIRLALDEEHVQEIIRTLIHDNLNDRLKEYTTTIIEEVMASMNKKLKYELRIAKDLSYSIDATIRHTMQKTPISCSSEQIIKNKIMSLLESFKPSNSNSQIENKNSVEE